MAMFTLRKLQRNLVGKYVLFENHLNKQDVRRIILISSIQPYLHYNYVMTINKGLPDEKNIKRAVLEDLVTVGEYKADLGKQFGWWSYKIVSGVC